MLLTINGLIHLCPDLTCAFDFLNGTCFIHSGDSPVTEVKLYSCGEDEVCNIADGDYAWFNTKF
jgi:hypothetical protein